MFVTRKLRSALHRMLGTTNGRRFSDEVLAERNAHEKALDLVRAMLNDAATDRAAVLGELSATAAINQRLLTAFVQQASEVRSELSQRQGNAYRYPDATQAFADHYVQWRQKRIDTIVRHYGESFFAGKRVLELGCGYGDLGAEFVRLGADVTCSDARPEHLDVVRQRHPEVHTVVADLDREWPFEGRWDLVLHLGLLYHLRTPEPSIRWACAATGHLVLESEVCDSLDPRLILQTQEAGYDQAHNGRGCRPSTGCVETILRECGVQYERLRDTGCNSGIHTYDWTELNTGAWRHGLRRMWFACTEPTQPASG